MSWRIVVEPFVRPMMHAFWRIRRGMTLGVRAIAENSQGQIALVRHTYIAGWHLPGGGVEAGESAAFAMERELAEEAGIQATGGLRLLGIFTNHAHFRGDHILVYHLTDWSACEPDNEGEIEAVGWFSPDTLPEDTSPATRRRIEEVYQRRTVTAVW